jgi:hypothetical protein
MLSVFEKHKVSFVAVTQQFNTSTSLGRLTLNILLSFAQFERELIGERTRDKMGAARLGEDALRIAVREFVAHYHGERNHQGIGNLLIFPEISLADRAGPVRCRSRLGGMLNYYDRAA